ncbi:GNAT family N-acetyltransferase [Pediococcus stilesii]|uniref:GNAT family N-acetyltransferase n=1 Tax=Pediococcus stilesii TaxID=331679 RepID=A0A5R9BUS3_9LACO|nr:GNAT family N-acetyltransferase [Pediococcus stilesii]TLQ04468.1 GNAT family N-acetyltransferase [Pediococcus stilesii]
MFKINRLRQITDQELDQIMEIWIEGNVSAHDFISPVYWQNNKELVRKMIAASIIYVITKNDDHIVGFAGIQKNYLAGIFIKKDFQNQGLGKELLNCIKLDYNELFLSVYNKNQSAKAFYLKNQFTRSTSQLDKATGEIETTMHWRKE